MSTHPCHRRDRRQRSVGRRRPQPCPGNPDALGTARVLAVDAASTPRVGRKQFPHDACRSSARSWCSPSTTDPGRAPRRKSWTRSSTNACAPRSFCSAAMSKRTPRSRGANWPRATASATTRFRIRCSPAWRRPRRKPRSTAASPQTNSRSTAGAAAIRPRRSSAFPVSPRTAHCSTACRPATSWCSAPTSGPATGCRWARTRNCSLILSRIEQHRQRHRAVPRHQGADRPDAARLPARAETARIPHRSRRPGRKSGHFPLKPRCSLQNLGKTAAR